ncbi:hypothetical protein [Dechloromonas sp. HYN0024]|uniref:hypothetical protein n=1 Tax=Dechloromonas sp. HYN0024 TaxID=2231055 RepID=UPI000E43B1E3|nr:hypothetical protein [Dechloromonas sp. HYN0024]AXS80185.1 hypothetical protein HYN24_09220 [Dechloromonas sp. HYN0024]
MSLFLIGALRAIVEMLGWCLLGQGVLYVIAGRKRADNRIYQLFALITSPPRRLLAMLMPGTASPVLIGCITFVVVLMLWLGLAFVRKFL